MSRTVLHTAPQQTKAPRALHFLAALETQSRSGAKNKDKISQKKIDFASALQRMAVGLLGFAYGGPIAQKQENPFLPATHRFKRLDPLTTRVFQEKPSPVRQPFLPALHQNTALTPVTPPLARERFARPLSSFVEKRSLVKQTQPQQTPHTLRPSMAVARVVTESRYPPIKAQGVTPSRQALPLTLVLPRPSQVMPAPAPMVRTADSRKYSVFENKQLKKDILTVERGGRAEAMGVEEKQQRTFRQFPALNMPKIFRTTRSLPLQGASEHTVALEPPSSRAVFGGASVAPQAVPAAMLVHLATAPQPPALSTPAANTTYIGPVTISVPSGNPQAIAEALQNMAHQNNHVLASLATRGAV